jgi:fused signal recognition particle receptor
VNSAELYLVIAVVVVFAIAAIGGLALRSGRRSRERPPGEGGRPPQVDEGAAGSRGARDDGSGTPGGGAVLAPPGPAQPVEVPPGPAQPAEALPAPIAAEPTLERPAPVAGRMVRLRARLARSNSALGQGLLALLSRDSLDAATWDEVEETLLLADVGAGPTGELVDRLRQRVTVLGTRTPAELKAMLREELLAIVDPGMDRALAVQRHEGRPAVVLVVGVNGTGKTTTVGKLARVLVAEDKDVILGAADTFRAAAADQLQTWGARVGVPTVRSDRDGADPASVAFDAVRAGIEVEADVVLIDTAGRLQNKVGLMDELGKVKRVVERHGPVDEVLLVLDATTGQNGMTQATVFSQVVNVTGIVLTKLDGTAKGGIVVAVQRQLGVPVKLVGLGEGADDLAPFDPEAFVDALLS